MTVKEQLSLNRWLIEKYITSPQTSIYEKFLKQTGGWMYEDGATNG